MSATANSLSLPDRLRARVRDHGPISFRDWMAAALYDTTAGYYCRRRDRQGRSGDYRTTPEMSPVFGEVCARYFMKSFFDLGAPDELTICEVGAGGGHCAAAVLSTLQRESPQVLAATHYIIDEISEDARAQALARLAPFESRIEFRSLAELGPLPFALIFSNELIDAFPVNRVIGRRGKLRELYVDVNEGNEFVWIEQDLSDPVAAYCAGIKLQLDEGQVYEVNLAANEFIARAARLIQQGLLITVDYGAARSELLHDRGRFNGTLRAFHRHAFIDDLLQEPGENDLTTTIDWTQMQERGAVCGFETLRLEALDQFLLKEGALEVIGNLGTRVRDVAELLSFNAGARELIMPNGMAAAFQVLVQRKL